MDLGMVSDLRAKRRDGWSLHSLDSKNGDWRLL